MSAVKYIQKGLVFGFGVVFWGGNSEGVALLLLLHVTKQRSGLAPAAGVGDVGVRNPHPGSAGAMSGVSGAILVHGTGWEIFAAEMLFVSGLPRLAVRSELLNERKASQREDAPASVQTECFKERVLVLNF